MKIAIVGCGYVGLVTGVVFADLGNEVVCVDNDLDKLERLRRGEPTIYEPGLEELLRRALADGALTFSSSVADATRASEIVFIAVGTPAREDGIPDMTSVREVARQIARAIDKPTVVVNKSTVPVGSGDLVEGILRAEGAPEEMFDVVSNPEFLREGSAIHDTLNPDRVIIGAKRQEAANKLVELYSALERPIHVTDPNSAELIKYASNCFLATKISFANALSRVCELAGADVGDVAKGMGADRRIGPEFLHAGLGWGGSCLPKDVLGLMTTSQRLGYDFELLRAAWNVNAEQPKRFLSRLEKRLGGFQEKIVGVLGLAFKPNTDDIREAPSLVIIAEILDKGGAVTAFDPAAMDRVRNVFPDVRYAEGPYDVAIGADAVLLVTEWNEFKQLDLKRLRDQMRGNLLFDGRRVYGFAAAERAGLEYHTIGASEP